MTSLVHPLSTETINSGLDLFSVNPSQTSIVSGQYDEHHPQSQVIDSSPIEIVIPASNSQFVDLNSSHLHVQARVVNVDGSALAPEDVVFPTPLWSASLFSQVDCYLNGVLVSRSENTYGYRAFLETILYNSEDTQKNVLSASFLYRDTPGEENNTKPHINTNPNGFLRQTLTAASKSVDMVSKLHLDVAQTNRFLPPGVEIKLRFTQQKSAFQLQTRNVNKLYMVVIEKAVLRVKKVELNPDVYLEIENQARKHGKNFLYPLKQRNINHYTMIQNHSTWMAENLFLNSLPNKVYVCMVENDAFLGNYAKNPYKFEHNDVETIQFSHDGRQYPAQAYNPDFNRGPFVSREFIALVSGSVGISLEQFTHGSTIFYVDFTALTNDDSSVLELRKSGACRLEIRFRTPLRTTTTLLILSEKDSVLQITGDRQVLVDINA